MIRELWESIPKPDKWIYPSLFILVIALFFSIPAFFAALVVIAISWSIGYIKNEKHKLVMKIIWVALLVLFLAWYSLDFWKPAAELSIEAVS